MSRSQLARAIYIGLVSSGLTSQEARQVIREARGKGRRAGRGR